MKKLSIFRDLWPVFDKKEKRVFFFIFFLMITGAIIELLGIGIVVPIFAVIGETDIAGKYPAAADIFRFFGNPDHNTIVIGAMLFLLSIYIIKTLFLSYLYHKQSNFIYKLSARLTSRLFELYIRQPYTFHLEKNSAHLIRNATADVVTLASSVQAFLVVLTESFVLIGLFLLLVFVEPYGALLSIITLGISGLGFHYFTKKSILKWGDANRIHAGKRFQHLQQGLGATKDVKLLGREQEFIKQFDIHNNKMGHYSELQYTVSQLPRLFIELLAIVGLALIVISMVLLKKDISAILPTLALFAAAAFRLMPSVNRILGSIQVVQFGVSSIEAVCAEIRTLKMIEIETPQNKLHFHKKIEIRELSFSYSSALSKTIDNISLSIEKGESIGIIGESGAGKSTFVDNFLGLLKNDNGGIYIDGMNIYEDIKGWQRLIGYVPQNIYLTDDSIRRNIAFGLPDEDINDNMVMDAIRAAKLESLLGELEAGQDTIVGERGVRLSGGQRQRIGIARALYHKPQILVLDESTSSLDHDTEKSIMEEINAMHGEKTILIVAHRLTTVNKCDKIIRLEKGKLVQQGTVKEVLNIQ